MSKIDAWNGDAAKIIKTFDATALLNSPFKVLIHNSVKQVCDANGVAMEVIVPNPEGLLKAVAQARVLHPHKLNGEEIKFLRSALGLKSKELARAIRVSVEHMSRWEAGSRVLSPQSEMLLRIYTFVMTVPFTKRKECEASKVAGVVGRVFGALSVRACHSAEESIVLHFERTVDDPSGVSDDDWDNGFWVEPEHHSKAA